MNGEQGGADIFGLAKEQRQVDIYNKLVDVENAINNQEGGGGVDPVGIKNSSDERINPASEEKGEEINQSVKELMFEFTALTRKLIQRFDSPIGVDKTLNRIRETSIIESGTITTVTTLATLTTLANVDGFNGRMLMYNQNWNAWANIVRPRLSA